MAKSRALRFSMGTLLFLVLCFCGYLAGHKQGYRDGKAQWDIMPLHTTLYDVTQSLAPDADLDDIVSGIRRDVVPECWNEAGGDCLVVPSNKKLLVRANEFVHDELRRQLKKLHDERIARIATVGDLGLE